jgi:hypothetical protein
MADRLFWAWLSGLWGGWQSALMAYPKREPAGHAGRRIALGVLFIGCFRE